MIVSDFFLPAKEDTFRLMPPTLKKCHTINWKAYYSLWVFYIILPWSKLKRYVLQGGLFYIL